MFSNCENLGEIGDAKEAKRHPQWPFFLNNPASALAESGTTTALAKRTGNILLSAELCLVVSKVAKRVPLKKAAEYILGYSPMVGIHDLSLSDSIIEPATVQERSLPAVYARWGMGITS